MIGGYLYPERDEDVHAHMQRTLTPATRADVWNAGFLFWRAFFTEFWIQHNRRSR
jgi:hypothetical protein